MRTLRRGRPTALLFLLLAGAGCAGSGVRSVLLLGPPWPAPAAGPRAAEEREEHGERQRDLRLPPSARALEAENARRNRARRAAALTQAGAGADAGACRPGPTTLCLLRDRFALSSPGRIRATARAARRAPSASPRT